MQAKIRQWKFACASTSILLQNTAAIMIVKQNLVYKGGEQVLQHLFKFMCGANTTILKAVHTAVYISSELQP